MQSGQPSTRVSRAIRVTSALLEAMQRSEGLLPKWERLGSRSDDVQRFGTSLKEIDVVLEVAPVPAGREGYQHLQISLAKDGLELGIWRNNFDETARLADLVIPQVLTREAREMPDEVADRLVESLEAELRSL